jgi:hypothetical protein
VFFGVFCLYMVFWCFLFPLKTEKKTHGTDEAPVGGTLLWGRIGAMNHESAQQFARRAWRSAAPKP